MKVVRVTAVIEKEIQVYTRSFVWHAGHGWPSFFVTSAHACDETMVSFTQNGFYHANKVFRRLNTWGSVFGEDILQNPHIQHPTHPDGIKFRLRFRVPYSVFQSIVAEFRSRDGWNPSGYWCLLSRLRWDSCLVWWSWKISTPKEMDSISLRNMLCECREFNTQAERDKWGRTLCSKTSRTKRLRMADHNLF